MARRFDYFLRNLTTWAVYTVILTVLGVLCHQPFGVAIYVGSVGGLFMGILNEILQQLRKMTGEVDAEQFVRYVERFVSNIAAQRSTTSSRPHLDHTTKTAPLDRGSHDTASPTSAERT